MGERLAACIVVPEAEEAHRAYRLSLLRAAPGRRAPESFDPEWKKDLLEEKSRSTRNSARAPGGSIR
ncbi:MAG: hypothetical protein ACLT2T_06675 [Bilophila wadsworthia]